MDGRWFPEIARHAGAAFTVVLMMLGASPSVIRAGDSPPKTSRTSLETRRTTEQRRLDRIRSEIEELRERLRKNESQAGSILDALNVIDLELAILAREREELRRERERAHEREGETRDEATAVGQKLLESEAHLKDWMRETYKLGPTRYLRIVAASTSPSRVVAAQRAIEALSLGEGRRVEDFRSMRARLESLIDDLAREQRRLVRLQQRSRAKASELQTVRRRKESTLASVKHEGSVQKEALEELLRLESEIQNLLAALRDARLNDAVPDLGFERFQGLLGWPVTGPVAVPFGNVRHPRFGTEVPHPGIDITVDVGVEVTAVYDGRIVFSDWFRGYGPMIVIDHGDGYLSVYGHLGLRLVDVDDEVRQGDPIAHTGEGGTFDTTGLYFEIRHDGSPQDPVLWLLTESKTIAEAAAAPGQRGRGSTP
jgi:septal ring factor EnvC (AmiA/AmiB activator)